MSGEEIKDLFDFYDKNRDGVLTQAEIASVLRALGANPSEADVREMVQRYDTSGHGTLNFHDFNTIYREAMTSPISERELETYLRYFDKDGSGKIDREEFKTTMTSLGERLSEDEITTILEDADLSGNGELDPREFAKMLLARPAP